MPTAQHHRSLRHARDLVTAMRGRSVAVLGDAMLDSFLWGDATRISPEAPVPVVLLDQQTWSLGGAANVAANIAALGGHPILFGAHGADAAGSRLRELARQAGVDAGPMLRLRGRPTTVKYRVFARNKHLLRLDRELAAPLPAGVIQHLLAALMRAEVEAVVVSDYAKGAVSRELITGVGRICRARQLPWCVDPKLASVRYRDATVLKPNRQELGNLASLPVLTIEDLRRAATRVMRQHRCQYLLVTRGEHGMALFGAGGEEFLYGNRGQQVADVTGAGDTVSAVVGLGLAAGFAVPTIAELANRAGAYVVGQPGVAVVRPENLV